MATRNSTRLAALPHQGPQVLDRLRGLGPDRRPHVGREAGQHAGIEAIGLGQGAVGSGEVAGLARIDHDDRPVGQRGDHRPFVPARGFQHNAGRLQGLDPGLQPAQASRRARHGPGVLGRPHGHVQLGLRHIDPEHDVHWGSHSVPSTGAGRTPHLADTGSS